MEYLRSKLPLYNCVLNHIAKKPLSYHVPGHKSGYVFPEDIEKDFLQFLKYDLTEITGLDDLHEAEEAIQDSQILAANLYGVDQTYFLVNGSTVGNLSAILSLCEEGDSIIVQRDSHKSIFNAINLAKANAIFVSPDVDLTSQLTIGINVEDIKQALKTAPSSVKAIVLTNPTYYGVSTDLAPIVSLAHKHSIPVVVDEAHGAHFILGAPFPKSATEFGADIVIQSAHKTLPAMTMGSYLHVKGNLINKNRLSYLLGALQSSSPSYPIMVSLDIARYYVECLKNEGTAKIKANLKGFYNELNQIDTLSIVELNQEGNLKVDLLKLILSSTRLTGYELQAALEAEGIYTELADPLYVLLVLPLSSSFDFSDTLLRIKKAVGLSAQGGFVKDMIHTLYYPEKITHKIYTHKNETEIVSLDTAVGKICAETIIPYPPGIPLLLEGEEISLHHLKYLKQTLSFKGKIQGSTNIRHGFIRVFK